MGEGEPTEKATPPPTNEAPAPGPMDQSDNEEPSLADTEPTLDHFLGSEDRGKRGDSGPGDRPGRRRR